MYAKCEILNETMNGTLNMKSVKLSWYFKAKNQLIFKLIEKLICFFRSWIPPYLTKRVLQIKGGSWQKHLESAQ